MAVCRSEHCRDARGARCSGDSGRGCSDAAWAAGMASIRSSRRTVRPHARGPEDRLGGAAVRSGGWPRAKTCRGYTYTVFKLMDILGAKELNGITIDVYD